MLNDWFFLVDLYPNLMLRGWRYHPLILLLDILIVMTDWMTLLLLCWTRYSNELVMILWRVWLVVSVGLICNCRLVVLWLLLLIVNQILVYPNWVQLVALLLFRAQGEWLQLELLAILSVVRHELDQLSPTWCLTLNEGLVLVKNRSSAHVDGLVVKHPVILTHVLTKVERYYHASTNWNAWIVLIWEVLIVHLKLWLP